MFRKIQFCPLILTSNRFYEKKHKFCLLRSVPAWLKTTVIETLEPFFKNLRILTSIKSSSGSMSSQIIHPTNESKGSPSASKD
jgi:hypothetical protein